MVDIVGISECGTQKCPVEEVLLYVTECIKGVCKSVYVQIRKKGNNEFALCLFKTDGRAIECRVKREPLDLSLKSGELFLGEVSTKIQWADIRPGIKSSKSSMKNIAQVRELIKEK